MRITSSVCSVLCLLVVLLATISCVAGEQQDNDHQGARKVSTFTSTEAPSASYHNDDEIDVEVVEESEEAMTPIVQGTSDVKYSHQPLSQAGENSKLSQDDTESQNNDGPDLDDESEEMDLETRPLTEEEKKANIFYETAMNLLNNSNPDRPRAYNLILDSAKLNNSKAMSMAAQALIFGDNLPIDFSLAKRFLTQLAAKGDSTAQMVSSNT